MTKELSCPIADAQAIANAYNALSRYELPCATSVAFNVKRIVDKVQELEKQRIDILMDGCSLTEDGKPLYRVYALETNSPVDADAPATDDLSNITLTDTQYVGYAFDTDEIRDRNDKRVRELLEKPVYFGLLSVITTDDLKSVTMPAQILFPLLSYGLVIEQEHNG